MAITPPISYTGAVAATAHASDPRVFDAVWLSTTVGVAGITVTFQQGGSVQFSNIPTGSVLPFRTRLITALTGTGVACVGLTGPSLSYWFNSAFAITDHDTNPNIYDAIWVDAVGGGTQLDIVPRDSSTTVTLTVAAGQLIPIRTRLVPAATTATVIGLRF